ncbi:MAG: type IV toxin-antitoxin system AbiEi family antitoxin domain-containing protein [Negativicutes bacterium]|jgi:predicted transcriptional regulator of viral defense system
MKKSKRVEDLLATNNGVLRASDTNGRAISRTHLSELHNEGVLERVARGIYTDAEKFEDEMQTLQIRYPKAVYSHDTALFLHGMCDRSPLRFSVTVMSGYHSAGLKQTGAKIYYIKKELYGEGLTTVPSLHGNELIVYDIERTICDIVRSRSKIDEQIFFDGLKMYASSPKKDLSKLARYAANYGIEKIMRNYLEVLL